MKFKLLAVLAALTALLTGCVTPPEPTASAVSASSESASPASSETAAPVTSTLNIYCFQAGKADAFLLWNDSGAVLIDAGESGFGKTVVEKLGELGIQRLDYLIITHFDKDHVGGAKKILTDIPVGTVLQSNSPKEDAAAYEKYLKALAEKGMEAVTVRETLNFNLGEVSFAVDPPARESYQTDESNNSSLIVSVTHGAKRLLFTGDAENERLNEFLEREPGRFDLVKLPHHGAWQSSLTALLERTSPAWAVVTSSDEEPEDQKTLDVLAEKGVQIFLTRSAPVLITSGPEGFSVAYTE